MIIVRYFLYFIFYSFLGWCMEVGCKLREYHRFVNRGFLIGPLCTIYGYGVLLIVILIGNTTSDILAVFLKSILVCSLLEYFTSYFMEKLFNTRWWDYSRRKFNINGRICLETMIPFGLLGTFVVYILHPAVVKLVGLFSEPAQIIIAVIIFIIFVVDNFFSFFVMAKIKKEISSNDKDNTEVVRSKVFEWLDENSFMYRRLKNAYPNFKVILKNAKDVAEKNIIAVKDDINVAKEKTEEKINLAKDKVSQKIENHKKK